MRIKILIGALIALCSISALAQPGSIEVGAVRSKVVAIDTAKAIASATTGKGVVYFNSAQNKFRVCYSGTCYDLAVSLGGGTVNSVSGTAGRITSTGGLTPAIDISSTFEALLGKVANPLSQFSATTSAQLRSVLTGELGTGAALFDGAEPSSFILTNATDLPISGIDGFGTGVPTALGIPIGTVGSFIVQNGAGGTPSSILLYNGTGLPIAGIAGLASGVPTLLGTFSWTNFNSAITGTAPYLPLTYLDIDGTMAANSDVKIPSQKAVRTYVSAQTSAASLDVLASANFLTLTNQTLIADIVGGSNKYGRYFNASSFVEVRIGAMINVGSSSANSPRIYLRYSTDDGASYTTIGDGTTTPTDCISLTNTGLYKTSWLTIPGGAKADVFFSIWQVGGDGTADPVLGSAYIQFKK